MPWTSRDREKEVPGYRSSKRPSYSPACHHATWVILNERCARGDDSNDDGDRAMAVTSAGEHIGVSVDLKAPPNISLFSVYLPDRPGNETTESIMHKVNLIAAHRDVVLLEANFRRGSMFDDPSIDYFVYKASALVDPYRGPSLSLLPVHYDEQPNRMTGRPSQRCMTQNSTGILSCGTSSNSKDSSIVVADLEGPCYLSRGRRVIDLNVLWSGSANKWMAFDNVHVRGANNGRDLDWWRTDAVVPYRSRYLIWVDYYRGAIFADMAYPEKQPDLRYVPLPVNPPPGDPADDIEHGRGRPEASRSLCVTRSGLKFVSVDRQSSSNYGVGHWECVTPQCH